jgi:hypothetical protein
MGIRVAELKQKADRGHVIHRDACVPKSRTYVYSEGHVIFSHDHPVHTLACYVTKILSLLFILLYSDDRL